MTLFELLQEGEQFLELAGCQDASIDAREILLSTFSLSISSFLLERMKEQEETEHWNEKCELYRKQIELRKNRKPLQHILNIQEFMGLDFYVNNHVLIPRQDTETLVELVLEKELDKGSTILDLCTGSGCIGISLKVHGKYEKISASDLSEDALGVAKKNAEQLCEGKIKYYHGNLFDGLIDANNN